MADMLKFLIDEPTSNILIVAGLVFLGIAVIGRISGKIDPGKSARIISGMIGGCLIIIGLALHPTNEVSPLTYNEIAPTATPQIAGSTERPPISPQIIIWTATPQPPPSPEIIIVTATPQPSPKPRTSEFEVFAPQGWQGTGMSIASGSTLTIQYISSLWSPWPGGFYDAAGTGVVSYCTCSVIQGVSHASLIGRVDSGNPFSVGNSYSSTMTQSGTLYLRINDTVLNDNSGSIEVSIQVTHQ
jgi:hypothetical protein